jgi:hypothetical protein
VGFSSARQIAPYLGTSGELGDRSGRRPVFQMYEIVIISPNNDLKVLDQTTAKLLFEALLFTDGQAQKAR